MVLTKENVASQAFAEHILRLELPPSVEALFGRLVGYMALHHGTTRETSWTYRRPHVTMSSGPNELSLDVVVAFDTDVLASMALCKNGWRRWMSPSKMKANSSGTWMRLLPLHGCHGSA